MQNIMENSTLCNSTSESEKCKNTSDYIDYIVASENFTAHMNLSDNNTVQSTSSGYLISTVLVSLTLGLIITLTVCGNVLVIIAILREKCLQGVGNCLVLSLAVADLLVACLVMPLAAVVQITQEWRYGAFLCDLWTFFDVICCTASILHLLAIAVDRYWAVSNIDYIRQRNVKLTCLMIMIAWGVAGIVSLPPIIGWKDADYMRRIEVEKRCLVSQDVGYQIFATCSTFYVPLFATLYLYWKIFKVARERIRNKPGNCAKKIINKSLAPPVVEVNAPSDASISLPDSDNSAAVNGEASTAEPVPEDPPKEKKCRRKTKRESIESKRERKAAKTLAIITGVFVVCWLPFFIMTLIMVFCSFCRLRDEIFGFLLWLGYLNSMLNPIIYTIFSPDFRTAFRHLLCIHRGNPRIVLG